MNDRLLVTIERDGQRSILVFRADDFAQSVTRNGKLRWGSGRAWTVSNVEAYTLPKGVRA